MNPQINGYTRHRPTLGTVARDGSTDTAPSAAGVLTSGRGASATGALYSSPAGGRAVLLVMASSVTPAARPWGAARRRMVRDSTIAKGRIFELMLLASAFHHS